MIALIAISVLFIASCSRKGDTGPQGPQGNANVRGSSSFTVSAWELSGNTYHASFTDADITSDIVNYGAVEVYKFYSADNSWTNLPDMNGNTSTVFNFYNSGFTIYISNVDGSLPAFPGSLTFRAVAIASSFKQAHPNTNWKNYNEAMTAISGATTASANQ